MAANIVKFNIENTDYTIRPFARCVDSPGSSIKIIDISDFSITDGATILVNFEKGNTANTISLKIGEEIYSVYVNGELMSTILFEADTTVEFVFDLSAGVWRIINGLGSNLNTSGIIEESDPYFLSSEASNITSSHINILNDLEDGAIQHNSDTFYITDKDDKIITLISSTGLSTSSISADSIKINGGTNQFVLLAGGGVKAIDDFINNLPSSGSGLHFMPSESDSTVWTANAENGNAAIWNRTLLVTGVNILKDIYGHVTNVSVNSVKMPDIPIRITSATKYLDVSSRTVNNTTVVLGVNAKTQTLEDAISTGADTGLATAHDVATVIQNNELVVTSALNAFKNKIGLANDLTIDWEGKYEAGTSIIEAIKNINEIGLSTDNYNLNIDFQTAEQDALLGDLNIIYFTSDTHRIIYQGKIFSKEGYVYDSSLNSFSINTGSALGKNSHAEGYASVTGGDDITLSEGTDTTFGAYAHAEGNATIAKGISSHSEGKKTFASGDQSHAEGFTSHAQGSSSHAEGYGTTSFGVASHAEGTHSHAEGIGSHAEGANTHAEGSSSHAEGANTHAEGSDSHAEGCRSHAEGLYSHAEGYYTVTTNTAEHTEGKYNVSNTGTRSSIGIGTNGTDRKNAFEVMDNGDTFIYGVGEYDGTNITAKNAKEERLPASIQEVLPKYNKERRSICFHYNASDGSFNEANADYSFVIGYNNKAIREDPVPQPDGTELIPQAGNSFVGGDNCNAYHSNSLVFGQGLVTTNGNQVVLGKYNNNTPIYWGNIPLVIGWGENDSNRKNLLVLQDGINTSDPNAANSGGLMTYGPLKPGATYINDFSEYFEWFDGNPNNEDRVGYMVQLNGEKIELCDSFEKCIGIISVTSAFVGNSCSLEWHGRYLKDDFGRIIYEEIDGKQVPKINPNYDESLEYIPRDRRKEWGNVGILGQILARQDGTLEAGNYAGCLNGIATKSTDNKGYRVLKIVSDKVALVLVK